MYIHEKIRHGLWIEVEGCTVVNFVTIVKLFSLEIFLPCFEHQWNDIF